MAQNKTGYFDEAFEALSLQEICRKVGVRKEDVDEIVAKTRFEVEGAVYYLDDGRRIVRLGEKRRVGVFLRELEKMRKMIHSHPSGASFSPKDVELALGYGIGHIVAFSDEYLYSLKIDKGTIVDDGLIKYEANEVYNRLERMATRGEISKSQLLFAANHKIWKAIAEKVKGFRYEYYRIKRKKDQTKRE